METSRGRSASKSESSSRASASRVSTNGPSRRNPPAPRPRTSSPRSTSASATRSHGKLSKKEAITPISTFDLADLLREAAEDGKVEEVTLDALQSKIAQLEDNNFDFVIKIEKLVEERFNVSMRTSKLQDESLSKLSNNVEFLQSELRACFERLNKLELEQAKVAQQKEDALAQPDAPASRELLKSTSLVETQDDEEAGHDAAENDAYTKVDLTHQYGDDSKREIVPRVYPIETAVEEESVSKNVIETAVEEESTSNKTIDTDVEEEGNSGAAKTTTSFTSAQTFLSNALEYDDEQGEIEGQSGNQASPQVQSGEEAAAQVNVLPPLLPSDHTGKFALEGSGLSKETEKAVEEHGSITAPSNLVSADAQSVESEAVDPAVDQEANDLWLEIKRGGWPVSEVIELVNEAVEDGEYTRAQGDAIALSVFALSKEARKAEDLHEDTAITKRGMSPTFVEKEVAEFLMDINSGDFDLSEVKLLVQDAATEGEYSQEQADQIIQRITTYLAASLANSVSRAKAADKEAAPNNTGTASKELLQAICDDAESAVADSDGKRFLGAIAARRLRDNISLGTLDAKAAADTIRSLREDFACAETMHSASGQSADSKSTVVDALVEKEVKEIWAEVKDDDTGDVFDDIQEIVQEGVNCRVYTRLQGNEIIQRLKQLLEVSKETLNHSGRVRESTIMKPPPESAALALLVDEIVDAEVNELWKQVQAGDFKLEELEVIVADRIMAGDYTQVQGGVIIKRITALAATILNSTFTNVAKLPAADPRVSAGALATVPREVVKQKEGVAFLRNESEALWTELKDSNPTAAEVKAEVEELVEIGEYTQAQGDEIFRLVTVLLETEGRRKASKPDAPGLHEHPPGTKSSMESLSQALIHRPLLTPPLLPALREDGGDVKLEAAAEQARKVAAAKEKAVAARARAEAAKAAKLKSEADTKETTDEAASKLRSRQDAPGFPRRSPQAGQGSMPLQPRPSSSRSTSNSRTSSPIAAAVADNTKQEATSAATAVNSSGGAPPSDIHALPYGGDLRAASAAQDRPAMKRILAYNKAMRKEVNVEEGE